MGQDWADGWIKKLRERSSTSTIKDAKFLETQRIKAEQGTGLWKDIQGWLSNKYGLINDGMGEVVVRPDPEPASTPGDQVRLLFQSRRLKALFDHATNRLTFECPLGSRKGEWEMFVDERGDAHFGHGMIASNPETIAEQMLNALLNGYASE